MRLLRRVTGGRTPISSSGAGLTAIDTRSQSDNATIRSMPGDSPRSEAHSGIRFVDRGAKPLEGISDESRLFAVAPVN